MASLEITDQMADAFTPEWRASRELIASLVGLLAGRRPTSILEFGPGLSTVLLSQYLNISSASLVVVDEPGPFHENMLKATRQGTASRASCDFIACKADGDEFYPIAMRADDERRIARNAPYDLIIVDGPGSSEARDTPEARRLLTALATPETIFVIDDSNRVPEARLVGFLTGHYPHRETALIRDGRFTHRTSTIVFPSPMAGKVSGDCGSSTENQSFATAVKPDREELPLISCVMPTYGRPMYVNEAVEMFLRQDYPNKELIILNDCPEQKYVCDLPGIRVVNQSDRYRTLGEKRNAAIELAEGELIAVWDDDDIYLPWRLTHSFNEMSRSGLGFYRAAEFWAYWGEDRLHDNQSVPGWVNHPNTLFTKKLWQDVGGYPPQNTGEDSSFFERIHQNLKASFIKAPVSKADRFFILRGKSHYHHMSISGGTNPLDTSAGVFQIEPKPIADDLLRRLFEELVRNRT